MSDTDKQIGSSLSEDAPDPAIAPPLSIAPPSSSSSHAPLVVRSPLDAELDTSAVSIDAQPPSLAMDGIESHIPTESSPPRKSPTSSPLVAKVGVVLLTMLLSGAAGWWLGLWWLQARADKERLEEEALFGPKAFDAEPYSPVERARKEALQARLEELSIDRNFFYALTDRVFRQHYGGWRERFLHAKQDKARESALRDALAATLLDRLSTLSQEARVKLGHYTEADRSLWRRVAHQYNLSDATLSDLTDARFLQLFHNRYAPRQRETERGETSMDEAMDQVWLAIADDWVRSFASGAAVQPLAFETSAQLTQRLTGTLTPGGSKVYLAFFDRESQLKLRLQANDTVQISVYSPSGDMPLIEDMSAADWSGWLPETGYYEIVLVSQADAPKPYQLDASVVPSPSSVAPQSKAAIGEPTQLLAAESTPLSTTPPSMQLLPDGKYQFCDRPPADFKNPNTFCWTFHKQGERTIGRLHQPSTQASLCVDGIVLQNTVEGEATHRLPGYATEPLLPDESEKLQIAAQWGDRTFLSLRQPGIFNYPHLKDSGKVYEQGYRYREAVLRLDGFVRYPEVQFAIPENCEPS